MAPGRRLLIGTVVLMLSTLLLMWARTDTLAGVSSSSSSSSSSTTTTTSSSAAALAGAVAPCGTLWVDFLAFTVEFDTSSKETANGTRRCGLYEVKDRHAVVPRRERLVPLARPGPAVDEELEASEIPARFAVLQVASAASYLLSADGAFGVQSLRAYASLHGYRHFAYVETDEYADQWLRYLAPKKNGTEAVLRLLDAEGAGAAKAVMLVDLDGWMNLTPIEAYSLEDIERRAVNGRAAMAYPQRATDFSILMQGEHDLCSCLLIVYRQPFGRAFWRNVAAECDRTTTINRSGTAQSICFYPCFEQFGAYRVLLASMNGTFNFSVDADLCMQSDPYCQGHAIGLLSEPVNALKSWPNVAFVPWYGVRGAPQLHQCTWGGCGDHEAIFYHTGGGRSPELRAQARLAFQHFIQSLGV